MINPKAVKDTEQKVKKVKELLKSKRPLTESETRLILEFKASLDRLSGGTDEIRF